jgi:hypothetical protein
MALVACALAVGPQPVGLSESAPEWKFGSDQRWERGNRSTLDNPAPGKYDAASGIGNQADSKKVSLPHFGFGTSTREDQERVFVTQEHNKTLFGRLSPGPSTYTLNPAMGKQHLSYEPVGFQRKIRNGSQPSWIFGKSERLGAAQPNSVPGPGAYKTVSAVAPQANSTKPSKPSYGFGTSNRDHAAKVCAHAHPHICATACVLPAYIARTYEQTRRSPQWPSITAHMHSRPPHSHLIRNPPSRAPFACALHCAHMLHIGVHQQRAQRGDGWPRCAGARAVRHEEPDRHTARLLKSGLRTILWVWGQVCGRLLKGQDEQPRPRRLRHLRSRAF